MNTMADSYATRDPCTLEEFLKAARAEGFVVSREGGPLNIIHADGRGCFGIVEEEAQFGDVHVGCMNNPHLDDWPMICDGTEEWTDIMGEEEEW
jgi:hypothetical protein